MISTWSPRISSCAAVLDDDFDRMLGAVDVDTVGKQLPHLAEHEGVGFGEHGQRTGLRRDEAELDGFGLCIGGAREAAGKRQCARGAETLNEGAAIEIAQNRFHDVSSQEAGIMNR
jgi:hypothetical protein